MEKQSTILAQLLASRLNHDYVAPLTAISNACELMQISPDSSAECFELISDSVESAISLLQFYRLAFGTYGEDEEYPLSDLRNYASEISGENGGMVNFEFEGLVIAKTQAKLAALIFLAARSSFMNLSSFHLKPEGRSWVVNCFGKGAMNDDGQARCEEFWQGSAKPTSAMVHFDYMFVLLEALRYEIRREVDDDSMRLEILM